MSKTITQLPNPITKDNPQGTFGTTTVEVNEKLPKEILCGSITQIEWKALQTLDPSFKDYLDSKILRIANNLIEWKRLGYIIKMEKHKFWYSFYAVRKNKSTHGDDE